MTDPASGKTRSFLSVSKGTTVMAISTILLFIFSFIGRVAVARAFSVSSWGLFSIGISLTSFLSLIALLGMHQAIARSLSFEPDPGMKRKIIRWGLYITIAASAIASVTVYVLASQLAFVFHNVRLVEIFQLFSVTVGFTLMSMFLAAIFQGFEDAAPNAWFNQVVNPGLFVVFVMLFLFFNLGFFGALVAYVLGNAIAFVCLAVYTWRRLPKLLPANTPEPPGLPKNLFSLSFALWGVSALSFVTAYIDTLILGVYRSSNEVGLYSSAMTLARLMLVGAGALTYIYLPVAARLAREGALDTIRETYATATRWILIITVPMLLLFAFVPQASLSAVFGAKYDGGATSLSILVIGSFLSVMVGPVNAAMAGLGYARTLLITTSISAAMNAALSFTLIPGYGQIGASYAWSISRAAYPAMGLAVLWKSDRISPFTKALGLPLGVSLAVGVPLFAFVGLELHPADWMVWPLYGLGLLIFVGSLLATRTLVEGDLIALRWIERLLGRSYPAADRFLRQFVVVSPSPASAGTIGGSSK
jgi:O-antigen/teichoic acid export membrane protein